MIRPSVCFSSVLRKRGNKILQSEADPHYFGCIKYFRTFFKPPCCLESISFRITILTLTNLFAYCMQHCVKSYRMHLDCSLYFNTQHVFLCHIPTVQKLLDTLDVLILRFRDHVYSETRRTRSKMVLSSQSPDLNIMKSV